MKRSVLLIMLLLLCSVSKIYTQNLNFDLHGSIRQWTGAFIQSPAEIGLSETRVKLELTSTTSSSSAFRATSYYIDDGLARSGTLELKEAYFDYYSDVVDVRFGKQMITWGKADELNPTDVLCPQNLTNLLEDKSIRKIGLLFLKTDWNIEEFTLTAIWKPEFDFIHLPPMDSRWAFFTIPGVTSLPPPSFPNSELKNTEWAFKLSRTIERFDLSISWFDGWDNIFTSELTFNPIIQHLQLDKLVFNRTKMLGGDFASVFGPVGFWGEGAYFITEDHDGINPNIKNPYFQYVLGTDYDFGDALKVNLQYFQEFITMVDNDAEQTAEETIMSKLGLGMPIQQALSCRIEKKFGLGEVHKVELMTIFDSKHRGFMLTPKFTYSLEDAFNIEVGGAFYGGESASLFGRFKDNHIVYGKGTYSF